MRTSQHRLVLVGVIDEQEPCPGAEKDDEIKDFNHCAFPL